MAVSEQPVGRVLAVQSDGTDRQVTAVTLVPSVGTSASVSKETYIRDDGGPTSTLAATAVSSPVNPVTINTTVTLTATPVGGVGPYRYTWTAGSAAPAVTGIGAMVTIVIPSDATSGTTYLYTVSVADAAGNTASASVRVGVGIVPPQPDPLTATVTASPTPAIPGTKVTLRVTPGGGTPSYTYAWSGPAGAPALSGATTTTASLTIPTLTTAKTWTYTCVVRDSATNAQTVTATVDVTGQPAVTGGSWPGLQAKTIVGLNVDNASQWDSVIASVSGAGKIKGRRIFFGSTVPTSGVPSGKMTLIKKAHADGQLPVCSFKTGGLTDAEMKTAASNIADQLDALGLPSTITYHHEPRGDMPQAEYVRRQKMLMPLMVRPNLSRGPILNGFLSESQWTEYESWSPDELMSPTYWDWFGADCYQQGDLTNPSTPWARRRMERTRAFLDSRGYTDWKILVGEMNGYSAASVTDCMNGVYDPANGIWIACMWDSGGLVLSGDRLTAFATSLDDPRRY